MRRIPWLLAIGALMVAACAPASTATPTAVPEATQPPAATTAPEATNPPATAGPAAPTPTLPSREQVVQVQAGEWVRGPEKAAVTIIEWGDFQ
jgi:hypothetical protein